MMTSSGKTSSSIQSFKDSLLCTEDFGLEDQVEAVQFLENKLEGARKLAVTKCDELKRVLISRSECDGEPPEKKQRLEPNTADVLEESRSTSGTDKQLEKIKRDLEDALKNVKTKEVEAEQLMKAAALKDAESKIKEHQLTASLNTMSMEKRQLEEKLAGQSKALEAVRQQMNVAQKESRKKLDAANRQTTSARNAQSTLQRQMNILERSNKFFSATVSKLEMEIVKLKKEVDESKAAEKDIVNEKSVLEEAVEIKTTEAEQLKKAVLEKDAELSKCKATVIQLKKIGRSFRERAEDVDKTVNDLKMENKEIAEKLAKLEGEGSQNYANEIESESEESKKEDENISEKFDASENCAKNVLINVSPVDTTSQTIVLPSQVEATLQTTASNELGTQKNPHQLSKSELYKNETK